jgi:hypothetical protein
MKEPEKYFEGITGVVNFGFILHFITILSKRKTVSRVDYDAVALFISCLMYVNNRPGDFSMIGDNGLSDYKLDKDFVPLVAPKRVRLFNDVMFDDLQIRQQHDLFKPCSPEEFRDGQLALLSGMRNQAVIDETSSLGDLRCDTTINEEMRLSAINSKGQWHGTPERIPFYTDAFSSAKKLYFDHDNYSVFEHAVADWYFTTHFATKR